jgi:hypothetical protein
MNIGTVQALVDNHIGEIRHQAAPRRAGARGRESWPAAGAASRPGLRSRIGFALVEAGLHLQITASPKSGSGPMRLNERS